MSPPDRQIVWLFLEPAEVMGAEEQSWAATALRIRSTAGRERVENNILKSRNKKDEDPTIEPPEEYYYSSSSRARAKVVNE